MRAALEDDVLQLGQMPLVHTRRVVLCFLHKKAAAAVATPNCPPLSMVLVLEPAMWLTLMHLQAIIRFSMLREYRHRNGTEYGLTGSHFQSPRRKSYLDRESADKSGRCTSPPRPGKPSATGCRSR